MGDPSEGPRPLAERTAAETEDLVARLGGRPFHARAVREAVFGKGVLDYAEMTSLSRGLREALAREAPILAGTPRAETRSPDGTTKLLTELSDGATVETVHIPSRRPGRGATLCISTQVGCPVGCPFCASGLGGLVRNLETAEILEQMLRGRAVGPLSRVVVMGIGEPLLNAARLERALTVVREEMGLGARRITVSTVGFPERVERVSRTRPGFQLAISLHSPFDEERWRLVPAMHGVPVDDVLRAGDAWFANTGREVTYEYVLLAGENDTRAHAERLGERLRGRRATVNLIPYNPVEETGYERPRSADVAAFREALQARGVVATVRWSRGVDARAACGQLRRETLGT